MYSINTDKIIITGIMINIILNLFSLLGVDVESVGQLLAGFCIVLEIVQYGVPASGIHHPNFLLGLINLTFIGSLMSATRVDIGISQELLACAHILSSFIFMQGGTTPWPCL